MSSDRTGSHMQLLLPVAGPLPDGGLEQLYDPGADPHLRAGFVTSVDGSVAVEGRSGGLHTVSDGVAFRALRAVADAVVVGAGTARSEGYGGVLQTEPGERWRERTGRAAAVPLVLVSRSLDLDPQARFFLSGNAIVVTCAGAPVERRRALEQVAEVLVAGDEAVDLSDAVQQLHARGLTRLLCEGGPSLLRDLLALGLVDELCTTLSPLLAGGAPLLRQALPVPARLQLTHLVDGGDGALLCRWRVLRS